MKDTIRKEYLKLRSLMPKEVQEQNSQKIYEKIIAGDYYQKADKVFVYIDMGAEVKTGLLIQKAWADGKRVAVPVTRKNRVMYFIEIKDFENLIETKFGTQEPHGDIEHQLLPDERTLLIVPGSVFDEEKNRYGYGGGFYDTYIQAHQIRHPVAVCYDFQVLEKIETEDFDQKMFQIITEKRIII